jgi:hypothetical protein
MTTRSRTLLLAALVGAAWSGGCLRDKQVRVDFSETPRDYVAKDYEQVYERWTRHQIALHDVDIALEVWATFKSWDYREAYIERYASIYSLSESDRAALRQSQLEALRNGYEFAVKALSTKYQWNDLEKSSSAWRVSLVDALGHELPAEEIKIEKVPDAYDSTFFPIADSNQGAFVKSYRIRFAVPAAGEFVGPKSGALTLRIASPLGRLDLVWLG